MGTIKHPFRTNPVLMGQLGGELRSRRPLVIASIVVHAVLIVAVLVVPALLPQREEEPEPTQVVFYSPEARPKPVISPELPKPKPVEITRAEPPPPPRREPELAPPPPRPPVRTAPKPRSIPKPSPPVAAAPEPKPQIKTDVFAETRTEKAAQPTPRKPRTGGFGRVEAAAPPRAGAERTFAQVGNFAAAETTEAPSSGDRERHTVVSTGFTDEIVQARPSNGRPTGQVVQTDFTGEVAQTAPSQRGSSGTVRQGGFGEVAEALKQPAPRKRPVATPDTPVEILSKARPAYTDQARELRIEGEVVLEVTFLASRDLRIHRVLDSLGYGLDEAAIEAATQIEFMPARRNGRPVDHTATLRVVFRLA